MEKSHEALEVSVALGGTMDLPAVDSSTAQVALNNTHQPEKVNPNPSDEVDILGFSATSSSCTGQESRASYSESTTHPDVDLLSMDRFQGEVHVTHQPVQSGGYSPDTDFFMQTSTATARDDHTNGIRQSEATIAVVPPGDEFYVGSRQNIVQGATQNNGTGIGSDTYAESTETELEVKGSGAAIDEERESERRRAAVVEAELRNAYETIESLRAELQKAAEAAEMSNHAAVTEETEAEERARLADRRALELEQTNKEQADEISELRELLTSAQVQIGAMAKAEQNAKLAIERVEELEAQSKTQTDEINRLNQIETEFEKQKSDKLEAETSLILAFERIELLEKQIRDFESQVGDLQNHIAKANETASAQHQELERLRQERDEQERKEMALTSRLNAAKMKEAEKVTLADQYAEELSELEKECKETKEDLLLTRAARRKLESELEQLKASWEQRLYNAEHSLAEERRLNEERKQKMKAFVESKSEELQQAKNDNDALQTELNQTNRSLMDLNNRWKQLHAQYVQSQTRNRELQRDMSRVKKDSENLHKLGDTLENKLSRSTVETEEHKNKRLAAKNELMTVLRTLEVERQVTMTLRDSIKFTFTPKALSQQQLLQESLDEFEAQLQKLSRRLGRPLPPSSVDLHIHDVEPSERGEADGESELPMEEKLNRDVHRLISKLERETQSVSQGIVALSGNVERMHQVLDASGDRTCYTVLSELISTGGGSTSPALQPSSFEDDESSGRRRPRVGMLSAHRYGTVPSTSFT